MGNLPRIGIISRSTLNLSQAVVPLLDYHKMTRKEFVTMGLKLVLGKNDSQNFHCLIVEKPPGQLRNQELCNKYTLFFNGVDC